MRSASLIAAMIGGLAPIALSMPAAAQRAGQPTERVLREPEAEFAEPFSAIAGVRELRDGRVIVSDRAEKAVRMVDFARGTMTSLGREGGGPNEYQMPGPLFALPGDSTAMWDFGNMRYLLMAPDGKVAGTFTAGDPGSGDVRFMMAPRGSDSEGNFYYFDRGIGRSQDGRLGFESPDSGTVLRYDRRTRAMTPVAKVAIPKMQMHTSGGSGQQRFVMRTSGNPFDAQDSWAIGLDGRVALVRHEPYRVEWLAPNGQHVVGPAIPYEKLRVTEKDKEEYRNRSATAQSVTVRIGGGSGSASGGPPPSTATVPMSEPTSWPEFKPPFLGSAATVAPDGTLWVLRTRPAGDGAPHYDVFDSFGRRTGTVTLPAGTRLVGFGRGTAYVVRTDGDDLQYLRRYRLW